MRRLILIPLLLVIAVLAIAGGIGLWVYNGYMYYGTDDAKVDGQIISISAPANGRLDTLSVAIGTRVTAGQTVATLTTAPVSTTPTTGTNPAKTTSLAITSPISGTVVQTYAVQNQQVGPGLTLLQVSNLGSITVTAYVDESAINNISNGQSVDITIDAYKDTKFTGHVKQIVQATAGVFSLIPSQDNTSGNFTKVGQRIPVIITLDDNGGKTLMPGMSAEVSIHLH